MPASSAQPKKKAGPKPKLTEWQLEQALKDHLTGMSMAKVAAKYGVHESTMFGHLGPKIKKYKGLASQIATAETAMANLPIKDQHIARTLVDHLKSISGHLAQAGRNGAMIASKLSQVAHEQSERIDSTAPLEDEVTVDAKTKQPVITRQGNGKHLQSVAAMVDTANKAAQTGINLLNANGKNNGSGLRGIGDALELTPDLIPDDPTQSAAAYMRLIGSKK